MSTLLVSPRRPGRRTSPPGDRAVQHRPPGGRAVHQRPPGDQAVQHPPPGDHAVRKGKRGWQKQVITI